MGIINKIYVWGESSSNVLTDDEFSQLGQRTSGFQPQEYLISKNINTALKEATLVARGFIGALADMDVDQNATIGINSSADQISTILKNAIEKKCETLFESEIQDLLTSDIEVN